tara:strand:- start:7313 stop:7504 length:192 start_codon:yes stop_codon:yes gene_type:complete
MMSKKTEQPEQECNHWFVIPRPVFPVATDGECKYCGAVRNYDLPPDFDPLNWQISRKKKKSAA